MQPVRGLSTYSRAIVVVSALLGLLGPITLPLIYETGTSAWSLLNDSSGDCHTSADEAVGQQYLEQRARDLGLPLSVVQSGSCDTDRKLLGGFTASGVSQEQVTWEFYRAGCDRKESRLIWWRSRTTDCSVDLGPAGRATTQFETRGNKIHVLLRDW